MKVLFLTRSLEWGGAERQLVALAAQLDSRHHEVTIAVFYPKAQLYEGLEGTGVQVVSLDKTGRWDIVGFSVRLVRLVRELRPDLVHSYLPGPNVVAALLKPCFGGTRLVWGVRASFMDLSRYDWLSRVFPRVERSLSRVPSLIICNSNAGRSVCVQRGFPLEVIRVIPNGIDTRRFEFNAVSRARLREAWGIPKDCVLIGLVARIDPMKDIESFLEACTRASAINPMLRFVCVGRGMSDFASDDLSTMVVFMEAQDDMPGVFSALDALCSSSRGEGFSNVIAEAMSCERPCLVTDVGDSAWIVGDTGWVVPPEQPQALADAFVSVVDADLSEMGGAARRRIVERFGLERMGLETETVLEGLIDERVRR